MANTFCVLSIKFAKIHSDNERYYIHFRRQRYCFLSPSLSWLQEREQNQQSFENIGRWREGVEHFTIWWVQCHNLGPDDKWHIHSTWPLQPLFRSHSTWPLWPVAGSDVHNSLPCPYVSAWIKQQQSIVPSEGPNDLSCTEAQVNGSATVEVGLEVNWRPYQWSVNPPQGRADMYVHTFL